MVNIQKIICVMAGCAAIYGCAQSTPSMMNPHKPELVMSTEIDQIPHHEVDDVYITVLASRYHRYGSGPLSLAMAYDPASRSFTARSAIQKLEEVKYKLKKKGIHSVKTETVPIEGGEAALMVTYDSYHARPPSQCDNMPGFDNNQTTRFIGDYKFGCTIETAFSKQIYRPADLKGVSGGVSDGNGRRAANVVEQYRDYSPEEAEAELETLEREDIGIE